MMVIMIGMIAFALDLGYMEMVRTQLQSTADSAALAAAGAMGTTDSSGNAVDPVTIAQQLAGYNTVTGRAAQVRSSDVVTGLWDSDAKTFTANASSSTPGNAVQVTVWTSSDTGGNTPSFFGGIFGSNSTSQNATSTATSNPRDIAFVVDLSGSMNDDTDCSYSTYSPSALNQVYSDFGFTNSAGALVTDGTEPVECIGAPFGIKTSGGDPLTQLKSVSGSYGTYLNPTATDPVTGKTLASKYVINSSDSSSVKKQKAYSWAMDVQLPRAALMPNAIPAPGSSANYSYWASYFDYNSNYKTIGYRTYTSFMMYNGRTRQPDGATYTPLSLQNALCPKHSESTDGGTFSFPPSEMPTHAARRAIIDAIKLIQDRNQTITNDSQKDWVSIITFDKLNDTQIVQSLTSNYAAAMQACTTLQACDKSASCTATDAGLIKAQQHIAPAPTGSGRQASNKIYILVTDGQPNLNQSSSGAISTYKSAHPGSNWDSGDPKNGALMESSIIHGVNQYLYPVGVGKEFQSTGYTFMDEMARMACTADSNGLSPRSTGDPDQVESVLKGIFQKIITNPKLRIVK
jgi:Flp pilus assembly protein TadG